MKKEDIEVRKLEELREIKRELQYSSNILQSEFVKTKDENGRTIRNRHTLEAPLEHLRKRCNMSP